MTDAPACPISLGQFPYGRQWGRGDPRSRPGNLQDQINAIPRAHDLQSAITALTAINNIVSKLTRGEPVINNTYLPGETSVILKGEDNNPHYQPIDWVEGGREYIKQKMYDPNDEKRFIEVKILKSVAFYNANTSYRLIYNGPLSGS